MTLQAHVQAHTHPCTVTYMHTEPPTHRLTHGHHVHPHSHPAPHTLTLTLMHSHTHRCPSLPSPQHPIIMIFPYNVAHFFSNALFFPLYGMATDPALVL